MKNNYHKKIKNYRELFPKYWLIRDLPIDAKRASLLFHVRQNDYFSTLATILRFYEESIKSDKALSKEMRELQVKTITNVMQDLLYLDKNYTIIPKNKK